MAALTWRELQELAIRTALTQPALVMDRRAGDVVFVIFTPRERSVLLVSPEEAAGRLAANGLAHYSTAMICVQRAEDARATMN